MPDLPVSLRLSRLKSLRDLVEQEITHRQITGSPSHRDLKSVTLAELEADLKWYRTQIEDIVSALENGL